MLKASTIVVTGGAGFIGSHLVDSFVFDGANVIVIDNCADEATRKYYFNPGATYHKVSFHSEEGLAIVRDAKPDFVFHLAAQMSVKNSVADPVNDANENVLGSIKLLKACIGIGVRKFLFASSGGAMYGDTFGNNGGAREIDEKNPSSPYGLSKLVVEQYLEVFYKLYGLDYTALRFGNVYGERQETIGEAGVIAIFAKDIMAGRISKMYDYGKGVRDYIHVNDVVNAFLSAMATDGTDERSFNIATGVGATTELIWEMVNKEFDGVGTVEKLPPRKGDIKRCILNCERAKREIGFLQDIPLEVGIKRTIDWFKAQK